MEQAGRLQAIQAARGVAALLVVFAHAVDAGGRCGFGDLARAAPALAVFGSSGVDLFFVISGFVMAHTVVHRRQGQDAARFLGRRIMRIVPLFLLVGGVYALANPFGDPLPWQALVASVTVLPVADVGTYHAPVLYVGWTLGFEFAFYAVVAGVLLHASGRHAVRRLLGATLVLAAAGALPGMAGLGGWAPLHLLFNPLQAEFALGIALWLAFDAGWLHGRAAVLVLAGAFWLLLGAALGLALPLNAHFLDAVAGRSGIARTLDWGVPWALILGGLIAASGRVARWRPLGRIGDASYALYLTHPFAMALAWRLAERGWIGGEAAFIANGVGASLALALLAHRLLERPLQRALSAPAWPRAGFSPRVRPAR